MYKRLFTREQEQQQEKLTTREDYEFTHKIAKQLSIVYDDIKKQMQEWLPNLKIYISPGGNLSIWTQHGHAIKIPFDNINVGGIMCHHCRWLVWINKEVEKVNKEPDKYFWCTECSTVQPKSNFGHQVFAGYYCNDCYNKSEAIQEAVRQSHEPGFYD